ncbi:MAG: hypothetical protein BGO53_02225 [Sphingobacteriales bacterium 39-19]|nr:hypothetical protein [Sphingobacteriales bacterium]OJW11183.1 MAG: hypothetical protein BGO53_02225 [Sphingobacteriales bacterium 39-19]
MIECKDYIHSVRCDTFGITEFIENTFIQFKKELIRLRGTIYNYKEHHYVFALNERAWVGVLNNAIIKAYPNTAVTLQEYGVYSPSNFVGRADFLVHWVDKNGKEFHLLFEAKQYEELGFATMLDDTEEYLNSIKVQGQKYFDAETIYYKDKTVYVIPIAFGWIRKQGFLSEAKKYFEEGEKKDKATDFCSLFFEGEIGVWVYGKIYDTKQINKL